jgi:hypothetical protein
MKRVRGLVAVLAVALVVGVAFAGTALAQGPWGEGGTGGEAVCEDFVDADNDGICDNRPEGRPFLWSESEDWEPGTGRRPEGRPFQSSEEWQPGAGHRRGGGMGRGRMALQES